MSGSNNVGIGHARGRFENQRDNGNPTFDYRNMKNAQKRVAASHCFDSNSDADSFDSSENSSASSNNATNDKPFHRKQRTGITTASKFRENHGGPQCTSEDSMKENRDPATDDLGRSKLRTKQATFGQGGEHKHAGRMRSKSPVGKPMMLSKRLSYKISSGTPHKSPVAAVKLIFSPVTSMTTACKPSRKKRSDPSSLENVGTSTTSKMRKKSGATRAKTI